MPIPRVDSGSNLIMSYADLPRLTEPIVEHLHEHSPQFMIAADTGARIPALAIRAAWKHKYPEDSFPTQDGRIHFLRIDRNAEPVHITKKMKVMFERLKIRPAATNDPNPTLCLVDDWSISGDTYHRFSRAARSLGLEHGELSFITLSGRKVPGVRHFVGNTEDDFRNSTWTDVRDIIGVTFPHYDRMVARPSFGEQAIAARLSISAAMREYYSK